MKCSTISILLILFLLYVPGFGETQTSASMPVTSTTPPASTEITGNLSRCGNWWIYAVDAHGNVLGDIPVTLHIMGIDKNTTFPDNTPPGIGIFNFSSYEIYSETRMTNNTPPYSGMVSFNDVALNLSAESNPYVYMDAAIRTADGQILYGRSYDYSLMCQHYGTSNIVLRPVPTSTSLPIPSMTTTTTALSTRPNKVDLKGYVGNYGHWGGYVINNSGGVGNVFVTLHIMSLGENNTYYEVYNVTKITNNTLPSIGNYDFTDITLNISGVIEPRAYEDAVFVADDQTFYSRTNDHTFGHLGVDVETIVLFMNSSTPTLLSTITPSSTPGAGRSMIMELFEGIFAILIAASVAFYRH